MIQIGELGSRKVSPRRGQIKPRTLLLKFQCASETPGELKKKKKDFWAPPPPTRISDSVGLRWIPRLCVSNQFLDDAEIAGLEVTL